jgi:hypothetical protein
MKKIFLALLLLCSNAFGAITDGKFGINQIFDVQYYWSGTTLNASNFIAPYNKNFQTVTVTAGQYFQFFDSTTNPGKHGLKLMNSNGTQHSIVHDHGDITALGNGAIFYIGSGFFGNVITTAQGYSYGSSASFTNMDTSVTSTDLNNYTYASSTPLAAGQTAAPPTPTVNWQPIRTTSSPVVISNIYPTSNNSPAGEGATQAFDGNSGTKYLNFDKKNAGVTVKLSQGRVVQKFTLTTANDFSGRDPTSYKLYGSNDGVNWVLIKQDTVTLSEQRFWTSPEIMVANTNAYVYYFILFPTTKSGDGCGLNCDSMQIAEVTFYYDLNDGVTSTATGSGGTPSNPGTSGSICADCGPTVVGGTITQTNAPSNQTIQSGGTYVNNSSRTSQQTRINTWANSPAPYSNAVYVDQIGGDNNNVTISLSGTKNRVELTLDGAGTNNLNLTQIGSNYLKADVNGYQNSLTTNQTNTIGTNYAETTINGNNNSVNHTQNNNNNRLLFSTVNGDSNTLTTTQSGAGQHYLDVRMTGNGHNVKVNQYGANANNAQIDVTNAGGAATVDLEQGGGKNFTLIQSCAILSGCNTTVKQQ